MLQIKKDQNFAQGTVMEAFPNTLFKVRLDSEKAKSSNAGSSDAVNEAPKEILAYLAGKMRLNKIKVMIGDRVELVLDPYGGKGRITRRF